MYLYETRVGFSRTDKDRIVTMESMIDYFQDSSCFQAEQLGVGFSYLEPNHLVWMLNSWQIDVVQFPQFYDKITVGTFPYDFKGFFGYRNFFIENEAGEKIVNANSVWTLMDTKKQCPARPTEKLLATYELEERLPMEYAPRKITIAQEERIIRREEPLQIKEYHLDTNQHVNNGQYVRIAYEYLPKDRRFHHLRVDYRRQAVLGDTIIPILHEKDDTCTVAICGEDEKPYAVIEVY